ncbi:MAG: transposase [Candidatus Margulisbacteria bacterium]|nr:transposase [Candidatus Margulisiibacteriota bacterium]
MLKQTVTEKTFFDDFVSRNFIPPDHRLVKIKEFLNLDFLAPLVKDAYNNENNLGRTPIDPKVLFMACLLQHLENLSDVEVSKKIFEVPLYRYFVGLGLEDKAPDDTTISFFRLNRMGEERFKVAFEQVIVQLHGADLIGGKIQTQDATNIRGNIAILNPIQLLNVCRQKLLLAIKLADIKLYDKWSKKFDFKIVYKPKNKQQHFEDLIALCQKLVKEVKKHRNRLKSKKVERWLYMMETALFEREDECFDDEGKKQQKKDINKITGKMINPSDPDVNWGAKSDKKFFVGYKIMSNMDNQYGIITSITVEKAGAAEEKYAAWLLEEQKKNIEVVPEHFVADAKYDFGNTRTEIRALQDDPEKSINIYIPLVPSKNKEGKYLLDEFSFENGNLVCPDGYQASASYHLEDKMGFEFRFMASVCATCKRRKECTTSKSQGRRVFVAAAQLERWAAVSFNVTDEYSLVMKGERYKIEPRQADLKRNQGLSRARYVGLARTRIQTYLAVMASNFKKMVKYGLGLIEDSTLKTLSLLAAMRLPRGQPCLNTT